MVARGERKRKRRKKKKGKKNKNPRFYFACFTRVCWERTKERNQWMESLSFFFVSPLFILLYLVLLFFPLLPQYSQWASRKE
jgi:hypothetical protein